MQTQAKNQAVDEPVSSRKLIPDIECEKTDVVIPAHRFVNLLKAAYGLEALTRVIPAIYLEKWVGDEVGDAVDVDGYLLAGLEAGASALAAFVHGEFDALAFHANERRQADG